MSDCTKSVTYITITMWWVSLRIYIYLDSQSSFCHNAIIKCILLKGKAQFLS